MPDTFWERSLFTKPRDRAVQCHASAWDLSTTDYRIKMCIDITGEDFNTIHHELGHNFYQRAYNLKQDVMYRSSAHDGFHEAIGDFIALSVTPAYLVNLGLLQEENWFQDQRLIASLDAVLVMENDCINEWIAKRVEARKSKDFDTADRIRDELKEAGILLEDKPDGSTDWKRV